MENLEVVNPHYVQQFVQAEEEFVTNYIYLENFSSEISNLENIYALKKSPLNLLTTSWHHLSENTLFKGDYRDADITDPLFPRFPTYDSFYDSETIQLVEDIFNKDFTIYKSPPNSTLKYRYFLNHKFIIITEKLKSTYLSFS